MKNVFFLCFCIVFHSNNSSQPVFIFILPLICNYFLGFKIWQKNWHAPQNTSALNVDILNRKHGNDLKFCMNDCFVILQPHYKWCKLILILDPDCTTKYKWYVPQNTSFSQEYYATAKFLWTVLLISWESQALDVLCLTLHIAFFHQFGIYFF